MFIRYNLIGGAALKNEGSENEGLWVQGDCRCRSPSLQLHVLLTVNTE